MRAGSCSTTSAGWCTVTRGKYQPYITLLHVIWFHNCVASYNWSGVNDRMPEHIKFICLFDKTSKVSALRAGTLALPAVASSLTLTFPYCLQIVAQHTHWDQQNSEPYASASGFCSSCGESLTVLIHMRCTHTLCVFHRAATATQILSSPGWAALRESGRMKLVVPNGANIYQVRRTLQPDSLGPESDWCCNCISATTVHSHLPSPTLSLAVYLQMERDKEGRAYVVVTTAKYPQAHIFSSTASSSTTPRLMAEFIEFVASNAGVRSRTCCSCACVSLVVCSADCCVFHSSSALPPCAV